jgi:hypothetical protein
MVSEILFGGLVFDINFLSRWAHFILVLTILRLTDDYIEIESAN